MTWQMGRAGGMLAEQTTRKMGFFYCRFELCQESERHTLVGIGGRSQDKGT